MLKYTIMGLTIGAALAATAGCSKGAGTGAGGDGASKLSAEGQATLKAGQQANLVPAELRADGVSVTGAAVKPNGANLEITGVIKNGSAAPVDGVNLSVAFKDAAGNVVGGHSTQQYFQPALALGKAQQLVLIAPALPGAQGKATAAEIKVVNLAKSGQSPDGWKPLDPKNLPPAKPVPGSTQQVTADGHVIEGGKSTATAVPSDDVATAGGT